MKGVRFWKTQTIGNDFVLFHASDLDSAGFGSRLADVAKQVCSRRFSIGSDGMLVVGVSHGVLQLRMFNPDGTEDFCGNGSRCAAAHARRMGWLPNEFNIEHYGRIVSALTFDNGVARTATGPAVFDPEIVPLNRSMHPSALIEEEVCGVIGTAINTGSTHFVTFVEQLPEDEPFFKIGSEIENSPLFPERTSVIFARRTGPATVTIRIWERGVGETLGCGTGSNAVAAELMRKEGRAMSVEVQSPGGVLVVSTNELGGSLIAESTPVESYSGVVTLQS